MYTKDGRSATDAEELLSFNTSFEMKFTTRKRFNFEFRALVKYAGEIK